MEVFLYSILVFGFNVLLGWVMLWPLKAVLFYPRKPVYLFGQHIPFTPAYARRKKKWLIDKLNWILSEYVRQAADTTDQTVLLARWEDKIWKRCYSWLGFLSAQRWLPGFMRQKMQKLGADLGKEVASQFMRNFVPFLMQYYKVSTYVELLDKKLDLDMVETYFHNYVYKWLRLAATALWALAGLYNMVIYWFLG